MTPITNEITFKITYQEYLNHRKEWLESLQIYKAFGKDWFVSCLEVNEVHCEPLKWEDMLPQCFVTFKLAE